MYLIDKESNKLVKVSKMTFKSLKLDERHNLQEWIANEPSSLGEDLLIIQKEFDGFADTKERLDLLEKKMDDLGMSKDGLQWYLDLRRYGGCQHAGFGLGFERLVMYVTGMENIRDVIPFARTPRNLMF